MKSILLSIIPVTIFCYALEFFRSPGHPCGSNYFVNQDLVKYNVYKIDSIHNYYIIYAKGKGRSYKIISQKKITRSCEKIVVNGEYGFELKSMLFVNGKPIIPANQVNEISGWQMDDSTVIKLEDDTGRNLFFANNLTGLCLTRNK
jgi:hypothetical protein